jgi:hypothetical protein
MFSICKLSGRAYHNFPPQGEKNQSLKVNSNERNSIKKQKDKIFTPRAKTPAFIYF